MEQEDLKKAIKSLNEFLGGGKVPAKGSYQDMKEAFMKGVEGAAQKIEEEKNEELITTYNALRDEPPPEPEKKSESEKGGRGKKDKSPAALKPPKKEKPAKSSKAPKVPKEKKELSRYGHRLNTMGGTIDDMLWEGVAVDDAVKKLSKQFGRSLDVAKAKFLSHVRYLPGARDVTIKEKDGHYKAQQATGKKK